MSPNDFDTLVSDMSTHLRAQTIAFLQQRGLPFDVEAYLEQKSVDLDQLAMELLFFGSDVWPIEPDNDPAAIDAA